MGRLIFMGLVGLVCGGPILAAEIAPPPAGAVRIATYNVAMYRGNAGQLAAELERGESQKTAKVAEVLQRVRPDVVLLNEFDYEEDGRALAAFREGYLAQPQAEGLKPIEYQYAYYQPVNTGVPSGHDLDGDGAPGGPADAWGYGRYPGQYGMVLLSKYPIDAATSRSFQKFVWQEMPNFLPTMLPESDKPFYADETFNVLRLSSKSHWDAVVKLPTRTVHVLCSHPTPPVFDGPEDRNGRRNFDEIRLIADYAAGGERAAYLVDDVGQRGGLTEGDAFVVLGDLNADPVDGASYNHAINQLLKHPRIDASRVPASAGGQAASEKYAEINSRHQGDPAHDTANFSQDGQPNLRCDYALPSRELKVHATEVYWPIGEEPGAQAVTGSDHRLVWIDVE